MHIKRFVVVVLLVLSACASPQPPADIVVVETENGWLITFLDSEEVHFSQMSTDGDNVLYSVSTEPMVSVSLNSLPTGEPIDPEGDSLPANWVTFVDMGGQNSLTCIGHVGGASISVGEAYYVEQANYLCLLVIDGKPQLPKEQTG